MEQFRLNVQVPMLSTVVNNLDMAGYSVSPNFPKTEDNIEVLGIIGNDILQYFSEFSLENFSLFDRINVKMIRLANGYIPFGSVINYIHPGEERSFLSKVREREIFLGLRTRLLNLLLSVCILITMLVLKKKKLL